MKTHHAVIIAFGIAMSGVFYATAQQSAPSSLPGCIYISGGITLTNLAQTVLMCDINGHLKVNTGVAP